MKTTNRHITYTLFIVFFGFIIPCQILNDMNIEISYSVRSIEERKLMEETYADIYSEINQNKYMRPTIYKNITGICYFNTVIQIMLLDNLLVEYFMNRNYDIKTQPVSFTIKRIFTQISKNNQIDLLEYVDFLSNISNLSHIISKSSGYTTDCYTKLMEILLDESQESNKISFFMRNQIKNTFMIKCYQCHTITTINYFIKILTVMFRTCLKEDLQNQELDEQMDKLYNEKCMGCNASLEKSNIKINCTLPEIFVLSRVDFDTTDFDIKRKIPKYPIPYELKIEYGTYNLCGVTIISYDGCVGHIYGIFKRGDWWFLYDDSKIERVNLDIHIEQISQRDWCYVNHFIFKLTL